MGSKSNRSRRYSEEFKRDAVALVRSSGRGRCVITFRPECRAGPSLEGTPRFGQGADAVQA
ncbi:hypothetical protein, partial [Streptomyces violaceorubidus]|uniref:hypothetical protein n=1 Tax=Streptomyces violaceorubidus TaxID=284042 RepID=UPI001ADFECCD